MDVAACLSEDLLTRLRVALGRDHTLVSVPTWSALAELLARRPFDAVVLEPAPLREEEVPGLLALLRRYPETPVVVYTCLTQPAVRATVEIVGTGGYRRVVFRGSDDSPRRFRALLEDLAEDLWESVLFATWVSPRLAGVPRPLAGAVERLFRSPGQFRGVADLAGASGLARRTVERWLARVGIPQAKRLVTAARIERAHAALRGGGLTGSDVALRLRYGSTRAFSRQLRAVIGRPPSALRQVEQPVLVSQLSRWVLTNPPLTLERSYARPPAAVQYTPSLDGERMLAVAPGK